MSPQMSQKSQKENIEMVRYHYGRAQNKAEKSRLIDVLCRVGGWERKYAIKILRGQRRAGRSQDERGRRGGSEVRYGQRELAVIKAIWLLAEQPCGKRLKATLALWLPAWERRHGALEEAVRAKVLAMSPSQMDRRLAPYRVRERRRPHLANEVRRQIPVRSGAWEVDEPGWMEADTVAHCGGNMGGSFIWSVSFCDIYSGWTEVRACWNRTDRAVHERLREMESTLPFALRGFDSDNGGEFINATLYRWLRGRAEPVEVTRSRPYQKNDNAHIEQKNRTHVRALLGWERFGHRSQVDVLDELLARWSLWQNLYRPMLKLCGKERVEGRLARRYEKEARTPAQRLLASGGSAVQRERIERLLAENDPLALKEEIEERLRKFYQELAGLDAAGAGDHPPPRSRMVLRSLAATAAPSPRAPCGPTASAAPFPKRSKKPKNMTATVS